MERDSKREDERGGGRKGERERRRGGGAERDGCKMITVIILKYSRQRKIEISSVNTARIIKYNGMHSIIPAFIHAYTPEARSIRTVQPPFCLDTFLFSGYCNN
jgi:hypothetical protein